MKRVIGTVAYSKLPISNWEKVLIYGLKKHLPDEQIVLVNQNINDSENLEFFDKHCTVIDARGQTYPTSVNGEGVFDTHGFGIDLLVEWCKEQAVDVLVHLDPDCVVLGSKWFWDVFNPIHDQNMWVAGSNFIPGVSLFLTPSAWKIDKIKGSFHGWKHKTSEELNHAKHQHLYDSLIKQIRNPLLTEVRKRGFNIYFKIWDTGGNNWFFAHINDKDIVVQKPPDLHHFWKGSRQDIEGRPETNYTKLWKEQFRALTEENLKHDNNRKSASVRWHL